MKANLMAGDSDTVIKEMEVKDLGYFIAYSNRAIKAQFSDRTIVRIMKDCQVIRILNRRGDELLFSLAHPNAQVQKEYEHYIQVA